MNDKESERQSKASTDNLSKNQDPTHLMWTSKRTGGEEKI